MVIGIIGGGQLGLMMAEAAKEYHHKIVGLDPNDTCPLSTIADEMIVSVYDNNEAIDLLMRQCDVVTYEFENVDLALLQKFETKIPQKTNALYYSRNRLIEKTFAENLGIKVPKFIEYQKHTAFYPSIIKTTTGGYDGKGQYRINNRGELNQFVADKSIEYIVEELVAFDYEISVIVSRDTFGNKVFYPIPKNTHRNGILFTSTVLEDVDNSVMVKAKEYTSLIVEKLDYVGTLAVEYFVKGQTVLFNEFAPRPHNSGHYTIEGCSVSQFENHILAITGEKVLKTRLINPSIMVNILGQDVEIVKQLNIDGIYYHDYKKNECKTNRKMGHITIATEKSSNVVSIRNNLIKGLI